MFESWQGLGIFLSTTAYRPVLGPTHPPTQWEPRALPLGVKQPGHETDHSPHLVLRSRMSGAIHPLPQYPFMAWCSVKSTGTALPLPLSQYNKLTGKKRLKSQVIIFIHHTCHVLATDHYSLFSMQPTEDVYCMQRSVSVDL
jgi:hypothetical protein